MPFAWINPTNRSGHARAYADSEIEIQQSWEGNTALELDWLAIAGSSEELVYNKSNYK